MLPYIDMTKPWYIQYLNEALTIDGQAILAYSDECEHAMTSVQAVFFNKKILDDLGLESPYTLVRDGTWTYDKLFGYAEKAVSDLNGDGEFKLNEDRFGFIGELDMFLPSVWVSSDVKTVEKDNKDIPYFAAEWKRKILFDREAGQQLCKYKGEFPQHVQGDQGG